MDRGGPRVLRDELEDALPEFDIESRFARPDRIQNMLERANAAKRFPEDGLRAHAQRGIAAQALPDHRQAEGARVVLLKHPQRREHAKHAI